MSRPPIHAAAAIALAASLVAAVGGAAQGSLPPPLPATPEASECTVAPRSEDELRDLATAALADDNAATPAPAAPSPAGEPADPETAAAVTETIRGIYACQNAGDYLAFLGHFTDELAAEFVAAGVRSAAARSAEAGRATPAADLVDPFIGALANPETIPEEARVVGLVAVRDVTVLPDGRVVAVAEVGRPAASTETGTREEVYVFVEQDGRYLVAGDEENLGEAAGESTPAP